MQSAKSIRIERYESNILEHLCKKTFFYIL